MVYTKNTIKNIKNVKKIKNKSFIQIDREIERYI